MKMAIIALVAILVLGGGAAGAYFYFDKPAEASAGPVDEAKKAEHEAKSKESKDGAETASLEEFVQLDVIVLPIIDETGVTQTVTLMVSIAAPDKATAEEVKRLSPRLKDAFIQDMYGVLNRKNAMKDGVIQVGAIKERLNRASIRVLGEDKVNEVLLQIVQQNPTM
jgi:flagellar protein FliL